MDIYTSIYSYIYYGIYVYTFLLKSVAGYRCNASYRVLRAITKASCITIALIYRSFGTDFIGSRSTWLSLQAVHFGLQVCGHNLKDTLSCLTLIPVTHNIVVIIFPQLIVEITHRIISIVMAGNQRVSS